uniref:Uncharacterized protein n=1 Tax=Salix viminalis TaxID=40686 RepID=A0A6N2LL83_SALVM
MITTPFHILVMSSELNCRRLLQILKTVNFELHVQEPFFTPLEDGLKTIEGSCAVGDNNRMASGAAILFNKIFIHASFLETMEAEGFEKVLPEVNTIAEEFTESDRQKRRKDPMESLLRVLQNQLPSPTFLTQNPPCESSRFLACKVLYA